MSGFVGRVRSIRPKPSNSSTWSRIGHVNSPFCFRHPSGKQTAPSIKSCGWKAASTNPFSLSDYPLDQQRLSIKVEDQTYGIDRLAFVIDTKDSGVGDLLRIPGWNLEGWKAETFAHDYETDFGDKDTPHVYSMARFSIQISRPVSFFFWKLLLPLFMVIIAAIAALLIRPQLLGERAALPAAALLSAIFLQKSYSDSLPDLGYLVLMDQIYLIAYPLIILTLIRVIYAYLQVEDAKIAKIRAVHRTDLRLLALLLAVSVLGVVLIVALR